jgi:hypothetical protein
MDKYFVTAVVAFLTSSGVLAQYNTDCTKDWVGNFSCKTKPSGDDFIDFGAFQRGAQQANQERQQQELNWQQLQMQQQMLEQQRQMWQQQEFQMRLQQEYEMRLRQENQIRLQQEQQIRQQQAQQLRVQQEQQMKLQQEQQAQLQQEQQMKLQREQQARLQQEQRVKREQELQLLQTPERLKEINLEKNTPEWQLGELYNRADGKGAKGSARCSYRTAHGFMFVKGKRYESFDHDVPNTEQCPAKLHVSKFSGRGCTDSCTEGALVRPWATSLQKEK